MIITLAPQFGYVLLSAVLISVECILIGFIFPGSLRRQVFSEKFMKQNFSKIHQQHFKEQIKAGGYPDMGNGVYSQKLSYPDWFRFNNAQRAHYNFVQSISSVLAMLVISGFYFPILASAFGFLIVLGRAIFAVGYSRGGPGGRLIGALAVDVALLGFLVLSIWSSINFIQQKPLGQAEF